MSGAQSEMAARRCREFSDGAVDRSEFHRRDDLAGRSLQAGGPDLTSAELLRRRAEDLARASAGQEPSSGVEKAVKAGGGSWVVGRRSWGRHRKNAEAPTTYDQRPALFQLFRLVIRQIVGQLAALAR